MPGLNLVLVSITFFVLGTGGIFARETDTLKASSYVLYFSTHSPQLTVLSNQQLHQAQ